MANCRICNKLVTFKYVGLGNRKKKLINIFFCNSCSAYFTNPEKIDYRNTNTEIIDYYQKHQGSIEKRIENLFEFLDKSGLASGGCFLDIGSGAGYSLVVAERRGWISYGIEPSTVLADYSKKILKLKVFSGEYSSKLINQIEELKHKKFHAILIDNVLEHVLNPVQFLTYAFAQLDRNGVLIVAVPPIDWLRLALGKIKYIRNNILSSRLNLFYDLEEHVNYFTRKSISELIKQVSPENSFELVHLRYHHSKILRNPISKLMGFETGYYIIKHRNQGD